MMYKVTVDSMDMKESGGKILQSVLLTLLGKAKWNGRKERKENCGVKVYALRDNSSAGMKAPWKP